MTKRRSVWVVEIKREPEGEWFPYLCLAEWNEKEALQWIGKDRIKSRWRVVRYDASK